MVFWLRQGLLLPEQDGERRHRRFTEDEVRIGALLNAARGLGLNAGTMLEIVGPVRSAIKAYRLIPATDRMGDVLVYCRDKAQGIADDHLGNLAARGFIGDAELAQLRRAAEAVPADRIDELWLADAVIEGEGVLLCIRERHGSWRLQLGAAEAGFGAPAAFAFDLAQIMPSKEALQ